MGLGEDPHRVGQRVRQEHGALSRRLVALVARVRTGEEEGIAQDFDDLVSDLLAHMGLEEHDLFPLLAFEARGGPRLVATLHAEHAEIRTCVRALQQPRLDAERLDALCELLRRHGAREEQHLYPWAVAREANPDVV